jgi:uncharacterized protein (TIRG00374 family)
VRRRLVLFAIAAVLLGLVVWRTEPWQAATLAARLDQAPLVLALALNAAVILLWAIRSGSLMAAVGSPLATGTLIPVVAFANTINNLTPGSVGEVLRAAVLQRRHAVPYASSTAVILAERLWAIGIMLVTAAAAAVGTLIPASGAVFAGAWLGATVLAFVPFVGYRLGLRPARTLGTFAERFQSARLQRLGAGLAAVDDRLADIVLRPGRSVHFVIVTALIFVVFGAQLWLVLQAFRAEVPPLGVWAAYGLSICAGVISALPFGLGAADAVLVALLAAQGVPLPVAGATAILLRAVTTLPLGIAGTISWIVLGRDARNAAESTA